MKTTPPQIRSDWMTVPDPENEPESSDADVDPFEELGVESNPSNAHVADGLEAFMDEEDDDNPAEESGPVEDGEDDDDDDDVFATLGVTGPSVALSSTGENDILAAFMDDDDEEESEHTEEAEEPTQTEPPSQPDAKDAYRMVLETVWVDGILDPGEVNLLARKREDLGISFEEHLSIVRSMLG